MNSVGSSPGAPPPSYVYIHQEFHRVDPPSRCRDQTAVQNKNMSRRPTEKSVSMCTHDVSPRIRTNLQISRMKKMMPVSELAVLTKISRQRLESFETSATFPSAQEIQRLETALEVNLMP